MIFRLALLLSVWSCTISPQVESSSSELDFASQQATASSPRSSRSFLTIIDANNKATEANTTSSSSILHIQATAIHLDKAEFPLSKLLFRLTLNLAQEVISKQLETKRVRLSLNIRSANTCSNQYAAGIAAEEYYTKKSRLFIVSGCDDAIRGVSRLASVWQVPVMTAAGFGADLNDKSIYKTLVRVAFSLRTAVEFLIKILKSYQWQRVNLIVDESDPNSVALRDSIEKHAVDFATKDFQPKLNTIMIDLKSLSSIHLVESNNSSLTTPKNGNLVDTWANNITEMAVEDVLKRSSMYSRVSILLIPQSHLRRFMLSAYDQNMANGYYTFINLPLILTPDDEQVDNTLASRGQNFSKLSYVASSGDNVFLWRSQVSSRNAQAKQAFESLMSIYLKTPTTKAYVFFTNQLLNMANSLFGTTTTSTSSTQSPVMKDALGLSTDTGLIQTGKVQLNVNPYSASFYDCLQIYAKSLEESISNIRNSINATSSAMSKKTKVTLHSTISELVRNRRYDNLVTGTVAINEQGDRETDYTLDDLNPMTGKYRPVILFKGDTREMERLARIHWSSDEKVGPTIDSIECHLVGNCPSRPLTKFLTTLLALAAPILLILGAILYFVYQKISFESQLVDYWWRINSKDVEMIETRRRETAGGRKLIESHASGSQVSSQISKSKKSSTTNKSGAQNEQSAVGKTTITRVTTTSGQFNSYVDVCYGDINLGVYKLSKVALRPMTKFHQTRKLMIELRSIKRVNHTNLCRFVGIVVDEPNTSLVSEFCPKGSLREFFQNESMVIDWTFKYSIINDIISGLIYLHSSCIEYHGRLKSSNCLVSSRFVVKLSDYGLDSLHEQLDNNLEEQDRLAKQLWIAPEHLKSSSKRGSPKGDVYSFGLLLYEIITNKLPFFNHETNDYIQPLKTLVQELKKGGPGDKIGPDLSAIDSSVSKTESLVSLMQQCWSFDVTERPSSITVGSALKRITHNITSKKLLENLTNRMEQYTNNLESLVDAKLATLVEEKQRTEELLYQFVPESIAGMLKLGETVEPEAYDCVTVFYSDIVGFTSLSSESTPEQVIGFLSDVYQCFDETLEKYDIFKVDTIGDAYIVASGLPERNDGKHVIEVACAAMEIRQRLSEFKIAHKKDRKLEMRVGIHSGPCIAGVVGGLNMPRYCVFGDTLTIGKFMESSGQPMKIHITEESKKLLESYGGFKAEPRSPKVLRDGIPFQTYWLEKN